MVGNKSGLRYFDGTFFAPFIISKDSVQPFVKCITDDKFGNLWIGTNSSGVIVYNKHKTKNYTTVDGLINNAVKCITEDADDNIWIGTESGASCFDSKSFKPYNAACGLCDKAVTQIKLDSKGNLWFCTDDGISLYNKNAIPCFSKLNGLSAFEVNCITQDLSGSLWLGTYGNGIERFDGNSIIDYTTEQGLADNFINTCIQDKNGDYWFGGNDYGASCYNNKYFFNHSTFQGLPANSIHDINKDKNGDLWFATGAGVSYYNGKSFTNFKEQLAHSNVWVITSDRDGNLWFGTDNGITKYDWHNFTSYTDFGVSSHQVKSITQDVFGNIWMGTTGDGVICFNGKSFINYNVKAGLAGNTMYCITSDSKGNLWFGTDGGGISLLRKEDIPILSSNKPNKKYNPVFQNITTTQGLADDVIYSILEDEKNNIIIGTNLGITLIKGGYNPGEKPFSKDSISYFNQKTGYPIKDINVNAMYIDTKGILWAGTGDKLISFDYNDISKNNLKPKVVLQALKINNTKISWYDLFDKKILDYTDSISTSPNKSEEVITFGHLLNDSLRQMMRTTFAGIKFDSITPYYPLPVNLVLPCQKNNITFDYAAIEPARPFLVRYKFMLQGYDKNWNPETERTTAEYGNLFEGDYTFMLKAKSPDGIWGDTITYSFTVLPPWYRTWWAYMLYVISFVTAFITFIRWRESELKKKNVILEQKVEVRTAELKKEKNLSESLLLNILPEEIAAELKQNGEVVPKDFECVTVLFTDFKNFTLMSEKRNAHELVNLIDFYYKTFDNIISNYGIEKIKTIGDSYMCVGGLPIENKTNPYDTVMAALEIRDTILKEKEIRQKEGKDFFEIRIGLHTGPVIAGIVGSKKYAYDIWGDTVNIASRMESSSEAGKVNISGHTYELIKDKFNCTYRGPIATKNRDLIEMYFVDSITQQ
ncbi:MAG: hypothetical protein IPO27_08105 [Bacteroidetes bacterium]|nr:hypothetical protein [Bacteroidota bacterium]